MNGGMDGWTDSWMDGWIGAECKYILWKQITKGAFRTFKYDYAGRLLHGCGVLSGLA